jgi:hypothetical protein
MAQGGFQCCSGHQCLSPVLPCSLVFFDCRDLVMEYSSIQEALQPVNRFTTKQKTNSVVLVRKRTIPTERPPLVGEVSANFLRIGGVAWSVQRITKSVFSVFLNGAATVYSKKLLCYTQEAEWTPFQTHCFSENLAAPGI